MHAIACHKDHRGFGYHGFPYPGGLGYHRGFGYPGFGYHTGFPGGFSFPGGFGFHRGTYYQSGE